MESIAWPSCEEDRRGIYSKYFRLLSPRNLESIYCIIISCLVPYSICHNETHRFDCGELGLCSQHGSRVFTCPVYSSDCQNQRLRVVKITMPQKGYRAFQPRQRDARSIQSDFMVLKCFYHFLKCSIVCFAEHANSGGPGYQLHFTDSGDGDADKGRESVETQEFYFEFNMGPANAQIPISVYLEGWTAMAAILLAKSASSPSTERISSTNTIAKYLKTNCKGETQKDIKNPIFVREIYIWHV